MSLKLAEKEQVVTALQAKLIGAQATVVAEYRGLTVAQMTAFRAEAQKAVGARAGCEEHAVEACPRGNILRGDGPLIKGSFGVCGGGRPRCPR